MTTCDRCEVSYPDSLTTQMFIGNVDGKSGYTAPVCGICALEISNESHGASRTRFDGKQAERMRQAAIRYRKETAR